MKKFAAIGFLLAALVHDELFSAIILCLLVTAFIVWLVAAIDKEKNKKY